MLLHGPASDWFSTLNLPRGTTFDGIMDKFKTNYFPSVELKWREMANVWNTKQGESESVNVFLTRLKVLSRRSKITESLHYAFLNGLKPQIRYSVFISSELSVVIIALLCFRSFVINKLV